MDIEIESEYAIRHTNHGILIFGKIPLNDVIEISKALAKIYDYDLCDASISQHYGAAMCITSKEKSQSWEEKSQSWEEKWKNASNAKAM